MSPLAMWRCVDLALTDISEELQPPAPAGSPLSDFSTLKMEPTRTPETSVNARSTQSHIPEDEFFNNMNLYCQENLKFQKHLSVSIPDKPKSESESESYIATDGQSASLSWNKAPVSGLRPVF
jgi:hypothetical protein